MSRCLNDFVSSTKPTLHDYRYCLGIDLNANDIEMLPDVLSRLSSVSLSTLLHTSDMDDFCSHMILLWGDYVNLEFWTNDIADVGILLLEYYGKVDFQHQYDGGEV
jgi:hypothetical protein